MTEKKESLKLLTEKSMAIVTRKTVVLPSTYRVVFSSLAKKHNIDIGAEAVHDNDEINDEVYRHIMNLDNNTGLAIKAIQERDEEQLQKVLEDVKELRSEVQALRQIAFEDGLTKALNRKWLEEHYIDSEREVFTKEGVIALIDLNDFKIINDTMGHAVGDKVLMHLAARLKQLEGHVVRYGGDEFLLIYENKSVDQVRDAINVLRELYLKKKFQIMSYEVAIKFAYGVAEFKAGEPFDRVIEKADAVLYDDKARVKERNIS